MTAAAPSAERSAPRSESRSTWAVRARFRAWLQSRAPRADTQLLTQRNVYILPTRAGWMFAITLVVLLLGSINYQLNLGYLLTFLLAGAGGVSMHLTHGTLRGLTLHLKPVAPVFAGTPALLDVVLTSPSSARHGVGIGVVGAAEKSLAWLDVPALGQGSMQVAFVPPGRGVHAAGTLGAETRFPFGLFRAWTIWRPAAEVLVYPRPETPSAPLPPTHPTPGSTGGGRSGEAGEVEGVRTYRRGDPPQRVAWKKSAQAFAAGGDPVSRDTSSVARRELWLDWSATGSLASEDRLSRLAAWVLAAERAGLEYGLRLPNRPSIAPARGEAHRRQCLEALARWPG